MMSNVFELIMYQVLSRRSYLIYKIMAGIRADNQSVLITRNLIKCMYGIQNRSRFNLFLFLLHVLYIAPFTVPIFFLCLDNRALLFSNAHNLLINGFKILISYYRIERV